MRQERAFTLLEVMVAMAILASSLALLLESQTQSVQNSNRSKMTTTAVLLARAQIGELEHELYEDGFSDIGAESSGDFSDEGFPNFRWEWKVETVELPTVAETQEAASGGGEATGELPATPGATALAGSGSEAMDAASSMMASQFELIRGVIEASVRRGTFAIFWKERATEQSFVVQAYFTDPTRVEAAMGGGGTPGQIGQGQGAGQGAGQRGP